MRDGSRELLRGGREDRQFLVPLGRGAGLRAAVHELRPDHDSRNVEGIRAGRIARRFGRSPGECCMTRLVRLLAALALVTATSCGGRSPGLTTLVALFGPIADLGTISGHVVKDDKVILMAGDASLVRIDLKASTHSTMTLPCSTGNRCWGLAGLNDGTLWTLKGMH